MIRKNSDDIQLLNKKILDLYTANEQATSQNCINLIVKQIEFYKLQIEHLHHQKPYWFQSKKMAKYHQDLEELNQKIIKCYQNIDKEFELIHKLKAN